MSNRKTEEIEELLNGLRDAYGTHAVEPYGDWDDPRSGGFKIRGIPAIFSVLSELPTSGGVLQRPDRMFGPKENCPTEGPTKFKHNH